MVTVERIRISGPCCFLSESHTPVCASHHWSLRLCPPVSLPLLSRGALTSGSLQLWGPGESLGSALVSARLLSCQREHHSKLLVEGCEHRGPKLYGYRGARHVISAQFKNNHLECAPVPSDIAALTCAFQAFSAERVALLHFPCDILKTGDLQLDIWTVFTCLLM